MVRDLLASQAAILVLSLAMLCCLCGCNDAGSGNSPPPGWGDAEANPSSAAMLPAQHRQLEPRAVTDGDWFEDVTQMSGVEFTYDNGRAGGQYTVLETIGGGVAMFDYDQDGDLDLFFTGGGKISGSPAGVSGLRSALFRNDGDWKFVNVTKDVNLDGDVDYSHGCAVGDFNRDGFPDLFVTCYGRSRLYRNDGGHRFDDITEKSGLVVDSWSTAAACFDYDGDGWLDLYVGGYLDWKLDPNEVCLNSVHGRRDICIPQRYPPSRERLFRNTGESTFVDVTNAAGLLDHSICLGAVAADYNRDGRTDVYVANDVMRNYLYLKDERGQLRETAALSGTAFSEYGAPEGSMGVDTADFDGDGDLDLFVTNYEMEDNSLYRNEGNEYFSHATVQAGLAGPCKPMVGFGTGFADFDSDGWLDLFVINGHVMYETGLTPYQQPSFIFRNAGAVFEDASQQAAPYFTTDHVGRGAAVGDLDNDGAVDLVIVHQNQPVTVLRNRLRPQHWLRLQLKGVKSNADAIGATATLSQGDRELLRVVRGGGGYLSHFDSRLLFPLTSDAPATVVVTWPGGQREKFAGLAPNRTHTIVEGAGGPKSD